MIRWITALFMIGVFAFFVVGFFPGLIDPIQKERHDACIEEQHAAIHEVVTNGTIISVISPLSCTGYIPAPRQPDYHRNITVIGKGEMFLGLPYECNLLGADGTNYRVLDEKMCMAARNDYTYDVVIGREHNEQTLIPDLIVSGNPVGWKE